MGTRSCTDDGYKQAAHMVKFFRQYFIAFEKTTNSDNMNDIQFILM